MLILSNTIRRVFSERYRVIPTDNSTNPENFLIQIDLELNRNRLLENTAKFFEINFYSSRDSAGSSDGISTFQRIFPNRYYSKSDNLKKYSRQNSTLESNFNNDVRKNIFTDYNTKFLDPSTQIRDLLPFDSSNFLSNESPVYRLTLSSSLSNFIRIRNNNGNNFSSFRIFILDEEKSIVAKTEFINIDLSSTTLDNKISLSNTTDLEKIIVDNFIRKINKTHFILNQNDYINIENPENLSFDFPIDHFKIIYSIDDRIIQYDTNRNLNLSSTTLGLQNFGDSRGLENISLEITKGLIEDKEVFPIKIIIFKNNYEKSKIINFSKNDGFIISLFEINKNTVATSILNKINSSTIELYRTEESINTIRLNLKDIDESSQVLSKIFIKRIYKNTPNRDIKYLYNSNNFQVSNRIDFKSISYNNLKEKDLRTNISFYDKEIYVDFEIKNTFLELRLEKYVVKNIPQDKILNLDFFSTLNSFLSQNIRYENIIFNRPVNSTNRNIFSYDKLVLRNINLLDAIAYNLGYTNSSDNVSGDIRKFLKNCIFEIQNQTNINKDQRGQISKTNYYFGEELFNFENFQNNFILVKDNILQSIYSEDFDTIQSYDSNLKTFFNKENSVEAYYSLLLVDSKTSLKNNLSIRAICFPEIMTKFLFPKTRIDSNKNIVIEDNITHTDEEENLLNSISTEYLSKLEPYSNINELTNLLFSSGSARTRQNVLANDFAVFFNILERSGFSKEENNKIYTQSHNINRKQILDLLNINNILPEFVTDSRISDEFDSNTFIDLSIDNSSFIKYSNFPITYSFAQTSYNSQFDAFSFSFINFLNDYTKDITLDISEISGFFDEIINVSNIKSSIHYLFSDSKRSLSENINDDQDNSFKAVNYKGKRYGTYSFKFIESNDLLAFERGIISDGYFLSEDLIKFVNADQNNLIKDSISGEKSNFIKNVIYNNKSLRFLHKIVLRSFVTFIVILKNTESRTPVKVNFYFNHEISPINLVNQYRVINNNINIINVNA